MNSEEAKQPSKVSKSQEKPRTGPAPKGPAPKGPAPKGPAPKRPARSGPAAPRAQKPTRPARTAPSKTPKGPLPQTPTDALPQTPTGPPPQTPTGPLPQTPTGPLPETPAEYQVSPSESEKAAIQQRAEGRARVPPKFRDGFKYFFFSPTGMLKVVRLGFLIGALACFIISETPESYITITVLETCIVLSFIIIYILTLHRLLTYLHWPLLDLINSCITAVFLLIAAALAMQEKERRHLFYIGGSLCLTAAIVCLIDATIESCVSSMRV